MAQLAGRAEALCHELLPAGRREGAEWRCGSVEGEPGKSLGVRLTGAKAGVWSDFASGEGGDLLDLVKAAHGLDTAEAIRWAKSFLGIGDVERPTPAPRARPERKKTERSNDSAGRTRAALGIWRAARPATSTPVEAYLRGRGITLPVPPTLRFHPGVRYRRSGLLLPCMVAAVQAPDRKVTAIHRTYIRDDSKGKAGVDEPKMALGPIGNGAIRLGPAGPALGIAEGIETALSASQIFDIPVWAALSVGRLQSVWLPPDVIEVQIFGDNGERGHEGAETARKTFNEQGRRVALRFPPAGFGDWNNFLKDQKSEAVT